MSEASFEAASVFLFGLLFGSFLNVVIYRLPLGQSIVLPGSRCPKCGHSIRWYENIPVLSWVALRARCSACSKPVSIRYPLIELVSGIALLAVHQRFALGRGFLIFAPFALAMVALFMIDYDHQLLPNKITYPGIALGLATCYVNPIIRWQESFLGAALGYGILWLLREGYYRLRHVDGMGGGDLKLAAMIGAFSGPRSLLAVLLVASLFGVAWGMGLILLRRATMQSALPFGCFLAPAAMLVVLLGVDRMWLSWRQLVTRIFLGPEFL